MIGSRPIVPPEYRLVCYDSLGSTNDEAKRLARSGAPAGTLVWAREQTAGRGRRGRPWASPRGNLYVSLICRPECAPLQAAQLGFVAALAVGGAVRALSPELRGFAHKWPNDVLLNGRKISGILLESEITPPDQLTFVVVGVGVNLVAFPRQAESPATSLAKEGLGKLDPTTMLEEFARNFHFWEESWREGGFAPIRAAWLMDAAGRGEMIRVRLETATLHGRFLDLDDSGILLLECAGEHRRISAGDVFTTTAADDARSPVA